MCKQSLNKKKSEKDKNVSKKMKKWQGLIFQKKVETTQLSKILSI